MRGDFAGCGNPAAAREHFTKLLAQFKVSGVPRKIEQVDGLLPTLQSVGGQE